MSLLKAPVEVRLAIYRYLLPSSRNTYAGKHLRKSCRLIQREFDSEVIRHVEMEIKKASALAPYVVAWTIRNPNFPLQLILPLSALYNSEYYDPSHTVWPDASNSLTYRILAALPTYINYVRVTVVRDVELSDSRIYLNIMAVKSAITSFVIMERPDSIELCWDEVVSDMFIREALAARECRLNQLLFILTSADMYYPNPAAKDITRFRWEST